MMHNVAMLVLCGYYHNTACMTIHYSGVNINVINSPMYYVADM